MEEEYENFGNVPVEQPPAPQLKESKTLMGNLPKPIASLLDENEMWQKVKETNGDIQGVISDLDVKLNRVLAKQEYEYLKGYNIYVKKKEKELRQLIDKLNQKNTTSNTKDK